MSACRFLQGTHRNGLKDSERTAKGQRRPEKDNEGTKRKARQRYLRAKGQGTPYIYIGCPLSLRCSGLANGFSLLCSFGSRCRHIDSAAGALLDAARIE